MISIFCIFLHDLARSVKNRLKDVEVWVSDYPMTSKEITSSSIFCDIHDGLIKPGKINQYIIRETTWL